MRSTSWDMFIRKREIQKGDAGVRARAGTGPIPHGSRHRSKSLYNDVGRYKDGATVFFKAKKRLDRTLPGCDPRINQSLAERHYELGLLYMRFERFQEAHHEFAKALNLEPDNVDNAVQMAKCFAKSGENGQRSVAGGDGEAGARGEGHHDRSVALVGRIVQR